MSLIKNQLFCCVSCKGLTMLKNIDINEKECIKITGDIIKEKMLSDIYPLSNEILDFYSNGLGGKIGLVIYFTITLPLVILLTPLAIPFLLWCHIDKLMDARREGKIYLKYKKPNPRHIQLLWDEYGLTDIDNDDLVSTVASTWVHLLYSEDFHIEPSKIKELFFIESEKQRKSNKEMRESLPGLFISVKFIDTRQVVLNKLFASLPNYG
jgi:hypothetical protein